MTRPLVGLTIGRDLPDHPQYLRLRRTYPDAVVAAGGIPVLIPPTEDESVLGEILERLNGVIFPGGLDVHPSHFGQELHPTTMVDEALDALELRLARLSLERPAPVLGICRGQQLLNVATGGSLVQDLPSTGTHHRQSTKRDDLSHDVEVAPDSRLAAIFGATRFQVNSFHHQGVDALGEGLRPVAWSPDGVVEAFESTRHPWLLAVQFHPEDLVREHTPSQRLFSAFVAACRSAA